jgi:ABC transporter DrrB family efflux protein
MYRQFKWAVKDTLTITKRNLLRYTRSPQLIILGTIQPVMFLLLFNFVFGGALRLPEGIDSYIIYLLPGIIVQTVLFGSTQAVIAMNDDITKGIIDRFKSLPMARSAVLFGRVLADTVRNIFVVGLMTSLGFLLGFRFVNGIVNGLLALCLVILFSFCMSWISVTIGQYVKDAETAQSAGFIWVFPLAFASSIFVPIASMPGWLQAFAANQPVSLVATSVRGLAVTGDTSELWRTLVWLLAIFIIFFTISVRLYTKNDK